jgi:hypothetical protein
MYYRHLFLFEKSQILVDFEITIFEQNISTQSYCTIKYVISVIILATIT